jgi:phenylalanine-4-hydroxylase
MYDYSKLPELSSSVFAAKLKKPSYLGDDWLEKNQKRYTIEEHAYWDKLYKRQMDILPNRACDQFFEGLKLLDFDHGGVPDFNKTNEILNSLTGWSIVAVPELVPDHVFFYHLANKRFPAGNFIRSEEEEDYIELPDVFHDVFGHVPMLTDPSFARYMEEYGKAGWKALEYNRLKALSSLYWYTVEFGLINSEQGMRIYGAGILSSGSESRFSLEAQSPNRIHLNVDRVMRTAYKHDDLQQSYFIIDSFEELFKLTKERPFEQIYKTIGPSFQFAPSALLEIDHVYHNGTQEYHQRGGKPSSAVPV